MGYYKKSTIIEMEDYQIVNAFEQTVIDMTKCANFTKRGVSPKLCKQYDWLKEELLARMK